MHTIKRTQGNVLEVMLTGRVNTDDYEAVIPAVESSIESQGKVRLVYDMSEVEVIEPPAIWEDVVFDMRHRTVSPRIAIVANKRWRLWATRQFRAHKSTAVHVFDADRQDLARGWVRDLAY